MQRPDGRTMLKGGLPSLAGVAGLPYNRPKLRITEVRPAEVRAHGRQLHVHIYTDQGITGQGEIMDAAQGNVPLSRLFVRILIGKTRWTSRRPSNALACRAYSPGRKPASMRQRSAE